MPRHYLKHGSDKVSDQAYSHCLFAAKPVAECESENCPEEGAELLLMSESALYTIVVSIDWQNTHREGARGDTGDIGILGLGKPLLEIRRYQNAREDALVVTEPGHGH